MNPLSCTRAALAALGLATASIAWAEGVRAIDARGVEIALARPAARIVTLAPNLAEFAFAAGAGAKVVGVSAFSDYPAAAQRLPIVASQGRVDLERLVALRPDLVLAWGTGNPARDVARVEELRIPVFVIEPRTLAGIARAIRDVGTLAATEMVAEPAAESFEKQAATLAGVDPVHGPAVFFEIWHAPLMTVSGTHLISEIVRRCGGRNVFDDLPALAGRVAREALLARDPDVILTTAAGDDSAAALRLWRDAPMLRAVRNAHIYALDATPIERPGPRVIEGARAVCSALRGAEGRG